MAGTNPTRSEWDGRSVNLIFNGWTDSFLKPTFIGVWRFMVFLSVVPSPIVAFCQVVLTEVMFDPIGSEQSDEFVEVYNTGELPIDLKGWVVGDGSKFNRIVGAGEGTLLAPGQYGIILDLDYFGRSTAYEELVPDEACLLTIQGVTFGNGGLANSFSERLQVCDPEGVVMAEYWTTPGNVAGHSDEKIDLERSDEPDNWTESITLHGSPGTVNTVARNRYDLKITASVIDPDRPRRHHPFTVRVHIVNQGKRAVSAWTTRFFEDINGDSGAGPDEIWDIQTVDFEYFEPGDSMEVQSR